MSKKNKLNKENSQSKITFKNPITFKIEIDGDDDFLINGQRIFVKQITLEKNVKGKDELFSIIKSINFEPFKTKEHKVSDFQNMIISSDFKSALRNLFLDESHFDHTTFVTIGGNQTIKVSTIK